MNIASSFHKSLLNYQTDRQQSDIWKNSQHLSKHHCISSIVLHQQCNWLLAKRLV